MANLEGTRASVDFICINTLPDVCKSPSIPVPYKIWSLFDTAVNFSTDVNFRTKPAFHHNSRLSRVEGNEAGVGGGILSGVNKGWCRPITHSSTVRVNGHFVNYHAGTQMYMNCAGPEGPYNTLGVVVFLGNMKPGPVGPPGKIAKCCFCCTPSLFSKLGDLIGDMEKLIKIGKQLYKLAKTDWSDPSSVLAAIGGVAGLAGLQCLEDAAKDIKKLYDLGKKIADTDWSDPKSILGTVAGFANVAGMKDIEKAAKMAKLIAQTIETDWSDPKAATKMAKEILKETGLGEMLLEMASDAITGSKTPAKKKSKQQSLPKPGSAGPTPIPPSPNGNQRTRLTPDLVEHLKQSNPVAYERYKKLSPEQRKNAFVEVERDDQETSRNERIAFYIPGEGFTSSQKERDQLWNVSQHIPDGIKETFVADKQDATDGNFFGMKLKEGNVYLFGGLIDLGSPEMPGAGTASTWWVPDRIFNMDFSPYYDHHDLHYYGSNVTLADLKLILGTEAESFAKGLSTNPLQLPFQAIYSAATTLVGLATATKNTLFEAGKCTFDSLSDFYDSVFGDSCGASKPADASGIAPGGCTPPASPAKAGAAAGDGKDGILITTATGDPAAVAAAIKAQYQADNAKALADAVPAP